MAFRQAKRIVKIELDWERFWLALTSTTPAIDSALSLANRCWIDCDEFDSRPGEEFLAIKAALKSPLVLTLVVAEKVALTFGAADLEVRTVGTVPLIFDGFDFVGLLVQLEPERAPCNRSGRKRESRGTSIHTSLELTKHFHTLTLSTGRHVSVLQTMRPAQ
jgi:hypothetical protein